MADDTVNLVDPSGELVGVAPEQVQDALNQGYRQSSSQDIQSYQQKQKYGGIAQTGIAALEGAGQGAFGPLSPMLEKAAGVPQEDITGRATEHPIAKGLGETAGFLGSAVSGEGIAPVIGKLGEAASAATGVGEGASLLSRAAATGVKGLTETALMQTSDEISNALVSNSDYPIGPALTNIGLSGILGGFMGLGGHLAIEPLWESTKSTGLGELLQGLRNKVYSEAVASGANKYGFEVPSAVAGATSGEHGAAATAAELFEGETRAAEKYREDLVKFKENSGDNIVSTFNRAPENPLSGVSEYDAANNIKKSLIDGIKEEYQPISQQFDEISSAYGKVRLPPAFEDEKMGPMPKGHIEGPKGIPDDIANKILNIDNGKYDLSPSSPQYSFLQNTAKEVKNLDTLDKIRQYQGIIRDKTKDPEMWHVGGEANKILRNAEFDVQQQVLSAHNPELADTHAMARESWKQMSDRLEDLNKRLHVGKYAGPESFIAKLDEMEPKDVLQRLRNPKDVNLQTELSSSFPNAAKALRDYHVDQLLDSSDSAGKFDSKKFFNKYEQLEPEFKNFILPQEQQAHLDQIQSVLQKLPARLNPSGTARTISSLMRHMTGGVGAIISAIAGHGLTAGALLGEGAHWVGREAPDALKLAYLKYLGSANEMSANGFRAMFKFIDAAQKGQKLIDKAGASLFRQGSESILNQLIPKKEETEKLKKRVQQIQENPQHLMKHTPTMVHYLPEHTSQLAQTASGAAMYLGSMLPRPSQPGPLDRPIEPSSAQEAAYTRSLQIAEQPLMVLKHINDGTLQSKDLSDLNALYPSLYETLKQSVFKEMTDHLSKDNTIPHNTRMGLSMFLGQPLDSNMTPNAIMAAQATFQAPQAQAMQPPAKRKGATTQLPKIADLAQTPSEKRQSRMG